MSRLPYRLGRYGTWAILVLAAIGGVSAISHIFRPTKSSTVFPLPDSAQALAIHAAIADVASSGTGEARVKALSGLGINVDNSTPAVPVSVTQADALEPQVYSSAEERVPVALWERVGGKAKTQVVDVLVLDVGGKVAVGGFWMQPASFITTYSEPSTGETYPGLKTFVTQFIRVWFSGSDTANDVANGVTLPALPFRTARLNVQNVDESRAGKRYSAVVTFEALDPQTRVWMPLQMIVSLSQPEAGHWMVDKVVGV